ncbi:DUF1361 domain-containing protein [Candidatus Peregrinibacteria bacterium]|nr:DUF1361 domain-containing protein [Candidatus Peregrinibacteria bacterium]
MKTKKGLNRKIIQSETLIIGVLLALVILSLRMVLTDDYYFFFLIWNLFLAFVPLFFAFAAATAATNKKKLRLFFLILCWLFFFPNAPYVITDFLHLMFYEDVDFVGTGLSNLYGVATSGSPNWIFWYDLFMIGFYSALSWLAGLCSLQSILKSHLLLVDKSWKQLTFFLCSLGLSGFGIFLGRFLRFNSWDVIAQPFVILQSVLSIFTNDFLLYLAFVVSAGFALLLIATFVLFDAQFEFRFAEFGKIEKGRGKK